MSKALEEVEEIERALPAPTRTAALLALAALLFLAYTVYAAARALWIFVIFAQPFILASFGVAFGVAWLASRMVPDIPPDREPSWLYDLGAASLLVLAGGLLLVGVDAFTFYAVLAGLSLALALVGRPKFRAAIEPVAAGAAAGFVGFIIALLVSAVLGALLGQGAMLPLRELRLGFLQVTPLEQLFIIAFIEELMARVAWFGGMARSMGLRGAVFWSTAFFLILHIPSRLWLLWLAPVVIGIIGLALLPLIVVFAKYARHPLCTIAGHLTYNTLLAALESPFTGLADLAVLAALLYVLRMYGKRVVARA